MATRKPQAAAPDPEPEASVETPAQAVEPRRIRGSVDDEWA
jgi:hypothetical protein